MTDIQEDYLVNADVWMIDGTFRTAPKDYCQVLNIMGANLIKKTYLTVGHILLKSKKESDYSTSLSLFITQIISSLNFLRVKTIITDFEKALINSIQTTIKTFRFDQILGRNIRLQGCLFHFSQCIIKTFSKYYRKDKVTKEMKIVLYVFLFAPYIEINYFSKWFFELLNKNSKVHQFLIYFKKNWLKNPSLWNVSDCIDESILTNCALESYHVRLNSAIQASPSIDNFSNHLYSFDMKNFRELHQSREKFYKYRTFLLKKDEILRLMDKIVNEFDLTEENIDNQNCQIIVNDESYCNYDESYNRIITETLHGSDDYDIIDQQMDVILDNISKK